MMLTKSVSGNGGAYLAGIQLPVEKRSEVIQGVVNRVVSFGLEEARKASGKGWFSFYGSMVFSWFKKNWLFVIVPLVVLFTVIFYWGKKRGNKLPNGRLNYKSKFKF